MKSKVTIQEAEKLLDSGWILKSYKRADYFQVHDYYICDTKGNYPGYTKYLNKSVFMALVKRGHTFIEVIDIRKREV